MENHALLDAIIARWFEIKMKKIIYILIFLNILSSCQKSDEKMEDLIVGEWKVEANIGVGLNGGTEEYPIRLPSRIIFNADGTYYFVTGEICIDSLGPYDYSIHEGVILFDTLPYCRNSTLVFENPIEVKKISSKKMILIEDNEEWKYMKQ